MIDLHVHTWRCRHAEGTAEDYVRAAARAGLSTMAFTEHFPLAPELAARIPHPEEYALPASELGAYKAEVQEAAILGNELGVEVLLGVELDLDQISLSSARMLDLDGLDIVLGSVHFIDEWAFDDPSLQSRCAEWHVSDLWERYFEDLCAAAQSGLADVMAHADLVKKFTCAPEGRTIALYHEAAAIFGRSQVAVEVSSAGLRKPCRELYPSAAFLHELYEAKVPVTLGSDAHCPCEVGAGLDRARDALYSAGYRSCLVFRNRVAEEVGLDEL